MRARRGGFSLIELMVVIGVAVVLTALLMPAMRQLQENAHRVVCMTNLQQMGQSFFMFGADHNDRLPYSAILHVQQAPQNLMASRRIDPDTDGWDGLGLLYSLMYCGAPQCFYCPSHQGNHPYERYANDWIPFGPSVPIFTNYHYAGHTEWTGARRRRSLDEGYSLVLATDGLRTKSDFNHVHGMNVLRADGSVRWREDTEHILGLLPSDDFAPPPADYVTLWNELGGPQ